MTPEKSIFNSYMVEKGFNEGDANEWQEKQERALHRKTKWEKKPSSKKNCPVLSNAEENPSNILR